MKHSILYILVTLCFAGQMMAQNIAFKGNVTYQLNFSTGKMTFDVDKIENKSSSDKSDSLKLQLFFCDEAFTSGSITGYIGGEYKFSKMLNANEYFYNLKKSVDFVCPPDGDYYPVVVVVEWNGSQYFVSDFVSFSRMHIETDATGAIHGTKR